MMALFKTRRPALFSARWERTRPGRCNLGSGLPAPPVRQAGGQGGISDFRRSCASRERERAGKAIGRRAAAFSLVEMVITISLIVLVAAVALPSILGIFGAGADSQAYNLIAAQLRAARAHAIGTGRYAGVHVQMADPSAKPDLAGAFYSAVVSYDPSLGAFVLADGFTPRRMPGGIAFGELSGKFVNTGGYVNLGDPNDLADFTAFTVVFSPSGSVVTMVEGERILCNSDPNDPLFGLNASTRVWDAGVANNGGPGEPGVTAMTLFDYTAFTAGDEADRIAFLNEHGRFLPVNVHTGLLFPRD